METLERRKIENACLHKSKITGVVNYDYDSFRNQPSTPEVQFNTEIRIHRQKFNEKNSDLLIPLVFSAVIN